MLALPHGTAAVWLSVLFAPLHVSFRTADVQLNEPHTSDGFETKLSWPSQFGDVGMTIGRGQLVGRLVNQFLCKAATFIKANDPNHMVTTGARRGACTARRGAAGRAGAAGR